jgi:hypothetical protein
MKMPRITIGCYAVIIGVLVSPVMMVSQEVNRLPSYVVPFASTDNRIELVIENGASVGTNAVEVQAVKVPTWIKMTPERQTLAQALLSGDTGVVAFVFSINRMVPSGKPESIQFVISTPEGSQWTKEIQIEVAAPLEYRLEQNYPNPFNPSTTIRYILPTASSVTLSVYNVLGEEVTTLVSNERKEPGEFHAEWNAGNNPSGVYFYRITAGSFTETKKLVLIK